MFSELLLGMLVLAGVILVLLVIGSVRRGARRHERPILAMVTEIRLEATAWGNYWYVTAMWQDAATGRAHTFRSRVRRRPRQRVGDTVTVICNPDRPKRFWMELWL